MMKRALGLCVLAVAVWGSSRVSFAETAPSCVIPGSQGGPIQEPFQVNPQDSCQWCNPSINASAWIPDPNVPYGTSCGTNLICCNLGGAGTCDSACYVGGSCYANSIPNPANVCQSCQTGNSNTAWSNLTNGTVCGPSGPGVPAGCASGPCACENGNCLSTCLVITPIPLNFGSVSQNPTTHAYCASQPLTVTLTNTCTSNLTVTGISSNNAAFPLSGLPAFPLTIVGNGGANNPTTFQATFALTNGGVQVGTISVVVTGDGTYTDTMNGTAVGGSAQNTDSFTVSTIPTWVDMLWSVDVDDCGGGWWPSIGSSLIPSMWSQGNALNINFNMGITNTYLTAGGDQGHIEPCPTCAHTTNGDGTTTKVFNSANGTTAMNELISLFPSNCGQWCAGAAQCGWDACPSGPDPGNGAWVDDQQLCQGYFNDEDMFDSMSAVLQPAMINGGPNSGLVRTGPEPGVPSYLGVVTLEDDNEDNHGWFYGANVAAYYNFLVGVKGQASLVTWSYASSSAIGESWGTPPTGSGNASCKKPCPGCIPAGNCAGPPYVTALAAKSGGIITDMTQATWVQQLVGIWAAIEAQGEENFNLTEQPGAGMTVTVNGTAVAGNAAGCPATGAQQWCWNSTTDAIDFVTPQSPGTNISVSYTATCNP
jgi:hypothetical protein